MVDAWRRSVVDAVEDAVMSGNSIQLDELLNSTDRHSLDFHNAPQTSLALSPLQIAVVTDSYDVAKKLLNAGASAGENSDYCGFPSPLMLASEHGFPDMCRLLLSHGANVNQKQSLAFTSCYFTALHYAALYGHAEVCSSLIDLKAEVRAPLKWDTLKRSPFDPAMKGKHQRIVEILLDHCEKTGQAVPWELLFNLALKHHSEACAILVLQRGYYPIQKEAITNDVDDFDVYGFLEFDAAADDDDNNNGNLDEKASYFHVAAYDGFIRLMCLLKELNPQFLQEEWVVQQNFPDKVVQHNDFIKGLIKERKYPSDLKQLCKRAIHSQLGTYYIQKISALPLPTGLKTYLSHLEAAQLPK